MANFQPIYENTLKKEGGYQNSPNDSANYCYSFINGKRTRGSLIGTNRGISATALQVYLGRCPSVAEMKAVTPELAYKIYKKNFWDKINGDIIKSQSVASMIFQMRIGSGNLIHARQAINNASRKQFKKELMFVSGSKMAAPKNWMYEFSPQAIKAINAINPQLLFDELKAEHFRHYDRIVAADPKKNEFIKGWKNRLNSMTFSDPDNTKIAGLGFFFNNNDNYTY